MLVALALYDLCAVLTPCGPLKALVKLIQERPDQPLPGLLYEAEISADDPDEKIKLGLGDFVFYSVLVSKAAIYGFSASAVCYLVIISGLCATLVLLSVFQTALPALPISISLGVGFYVCTRIYIIPFVEVLGGPPIYI